MPPTLDQKWSKNEGRILDPLLGPFWGPLGAKNSPKRLPRGVSRGIRRETPKHGRFWIPPERPKVSSRLGGSTVFHIFDGSFLDPVLEPFWLHFGGCLEPTAAQKASQGTPRFWVSFWSQNGSQTGGGVLENGVPEGLRNLPGALLLLEGSKPSILTHFGSVWRAKSMVWRPWQCPFCAPQRSHMPFSNH